MPEPEATCRIESRGVMTVRWPATDGSDPVISLHVEGDKVVRLSPARAREAVRQLRYQLGDDVARADGG